MSEQQGPVNIHITQFPSQDTIGFVLTAEHTIISDTVRLSASISGMVTTDMTEPRLREEIRHILEKLIPTAKWNFSQTTRSASKSGYEQIDLVATTRVPESENHSLERRGRDASREGLNITRITTDNTPPRTLLDQAESELRLRIIAAATTEREKINKATGMNYRLGHLTFNESDDDEVPHKTAANFRGSTYSVSAAATDALGDAVKLTMTARVTLLVDHNPDTAR